MTRFGLAAKILATLLVLSLVPLIITEYFSIANIRSMGSSVSSDVVEVGGVIANDTRKSLENLGAEIIKQKALDIAEQIRLFIKSNPGLNISELEANEELKAIAVQPVGKTGYTAVHDRDAINHFHVNPELVGFDLHGLADKFPNFWVILERSLSGEAYGYYDWEDADGVVRSKYMHCTPIEETEFSICATTYIDEFSIPVIETIEKIRSSVENTTDKIETVVFQSLGLISNILLLSFLVIIIVAFLLTNTIVRPVTKLTKATEEIGRGNLNVKIDVRGRDEIGQLASSFSQMTGELKKSQEQIKRHTQELEQNVRKRTKTLDRKIEELEESKMAILNMMEDVDQTNKELMETQTRLRESLQELKVMDAKKDEFISIAAHELKTPLTAIHGFSQLLKNRKIAGDRKKREGYLQIMNSETRRLAELVTDILELSRIDLGTIKFLEESIEIGDAVDTVKSEIGMIAKEKGLRMECKIEEKLPRLLTDREKLTQILLNLMNNAVKYTEKGRVELYVFRDGDFIHFWVRDTGIGISRENQNKIFERFYQVDSSYTRKAGGTGLGLALCKEYVEFMGGKIWVESQVGKGSTFHFTLPVEGMPKERLGEVGRRAKERLKESEEARKKAERTGIVK